MLRITKSTRKALSDHMPFIAKNNDMTLMSWNILCQMKFNDKWKYFNNGFGCHEESDKFYTNRLSHIISRIGYAAKDEAPAFICLQECPETDDLRAQFEGEIRQNEMLKNYEISYFNNIEDEYFLTTLYDAHSYTIQRELTEKISSASLEEGLAKRILPLVFLHKKSGAMTLIVNVHANFGKEVKKDVQLLCELAKQLGINHVAFLGDFNRDLVLESDNYSRHDISQALDSEHRFANLLYVNSICASSFIAQYNSDKNETNVVIETRDGIMSTFPVDVICMTDINTPNPAMTFTKELSPRLNEIPDGFLEHLESAKMS